ncbi:MAG: glycosyltransferase family 4 protein [Clostridia bacterium]|nr:glycosyltransferase family 4 protein [Clostridia bacterium]
MYVQYSALQKKQLLEQQYINTQSVRLLVCVPDQLRCPMLQESLAHQLHRNFTLTPFSTLFSAMDVDTAGIIFIREDVQLLSTALMLFAQSISDDADFVTADAAFGPDCASERIGQAARANDACIAMSAKLVRQVQSTSDMDAFIPSAKTRAVQVKHIDRVLSVQRRELCYQDLFSGQKKTAMVLCHEFSMTGAPIVLVNAVPVLQEMGFEVAVISPMDGAAASLFMEAGAAVVLNPEQLGNKALCGIAYSCDLILANTVCEEDAVSFLNGSPIPVIWWLHDAFIGYPAIEGKIPLKMKQNVTLCAVGSHAAAAMHSVRPGFKIKQLIYGLPDYAQDAFEKFDLSFAQGKQLFVTIGSFEHRKGQDIFCEAIRLLPEEERKRAAFLFVGKVLSFDKEMFPSVRRLMEQFPENVFYQEKLSRGEVKSLMQQCDCIVCASRDDPMPTFVTEGLIFGKPAIVSEHTGTAGLIQDGRNGFIYHDDDPAQLAERLAHMIDHSELSAQMSAQCRALYEHSFTHQSFANALQEIVEAAMRK